jgi:hypothetical protein
MTMTIHSDDARNYFSKGTGFSPYIQSTPKTNRALDPEEKNGIPPGSTAEFQKDKRPVRGTQLLVEHIGDVFKHPSLLGIEIAWRWLFGIPFLLVCAKQAQQILAAYPLQSSGFDAIGWQNPWLASVQLGEVGAYYAPHVLAVLRWLVPAAALAWVVISGLGRNLLLMRMRSRDSGEGVPPVPFRPIAIIALQASWLILLGFTFWGWLWSLQWAAATHIPSIGEPDLVGYFVWAIFLSLAFFTAFALASWPLSIAPLLALLEKRSVLSSLRQSFRLGKPFTSKLAEVNLVMGIVKMSLMVLALVFSAAPLPFAQELGSSATHAAAAGSLFIYCVANDFFQVVRLRAFLDFWQVYRARTVS